MKVKVKVDQVSDYSNFIKPDVEYEVEEAKEMYNKLTHKHNWYKIIGKTNYDGKPIFLYKKDCIITGE